MFKSSYVPNAWTSSHTDCEQPLLVTGNQCDQIPWRNSPPCSPFLWPSNKCTSEIPNKSQESSLFWLSTCLVEPTPLALLSYDPCVLCVLLSSRTCEYGKSFHFTGLSECNFHGHIGMILQDPTRGTCSSTYNTNGNKINYPWSLPQEIVA